MSYQRYLIYIKRFNPGAATIINLTLLTAVLTLKSEEICLMIIKRIFHEIYTNKYNKTVLINRRLVFT